MQKTDVQALPSRSGQFALVTPAVDFFMVGGLTLLLIPLALLPVWEDEGARARAGMLVFSLLFVLNFPHFIHGYQLLYPNYLTKLLDANSSAAARLRFLIAGIVSPLVIVAFLIYGSLQPTHTTIAYGANAVLFLTGWHYVKQGFGVLMTLSAREKVVYSTAGRRLLLINAYVAWLFSWILYNASFADQVHFGIAFQLFSVPDELTQAIRIVFFTWTLFAVVLFILNDVRRSGVSVNGMLAYLCSVYVWVVFANTNYILMIFIPALHSLQYLLFVWKVEYEQTKARCNDHEPAAAATEGIRRLVVRRMLPFLTVAFAGGVVYYQLATQLDRGLSFKADVFGPQYFMFCFSIFLNAHHYFIDFAIWRRDNPAMKYLYR
jgi:hypothetical protein